MATKGKPTKRPLSRTFTSYQTAKGKKATAKYPELENMTIEEGTEYLRAAQGRTSVKPKARQRRTKVDTGLDTFKYKPGPSGR